MQTYRSFYLKAEWGSRVETPDALAERFLLMIDGLRTLHPSLERWSWGDYQEVLDTEGAGGSYPLADVRPRMADRVARNLGDGGDDVRDPYYGYMMLAKADLTVPSCPVSLGGSVGRRPTGGSDENAFINRIEFDIEPEPDASLVTYAFWRAALLLIAEAWEATWAHASPADIRSIRSGETFDCAWMSTISPRFAPLITPPPNVIVEHRPNGGLFLAATDATFRTDDPQHVAAARSIAAALEPLNRLPYPIDDPYR